jgi:hypothetical protein
VTADAAARRYLLGDASEGGRATIEEDYFREPESADQIAQVEEELIEDYLAARLSLQDRGKFERVYLAVPVHRIRVETIRRLTRRTTTRLMRVSMEWLAAAAALIIIIAAGAIWLLTTPNGAPRTDASRRSAPATSTAPAVTEPSEAEEAAARIPPPIFAISLQPLNVRGAGGTPSYSIPEDAAIVAVQLEGEAGHFRDARATIQTVEGRAVWKGPANIGGSEGIIARIDVPSTELHAGDYIVVLFGTDANGVERERGRYVLRIRR